MTIPTLEEQLRTIVDTVGPVRLDDLSGRTVVHDTTLRRRKGAAVMAVIAVAALGAFLLGKGTTSPPDEVKTSATQPPSPDTCGQPQGLPSCVRTPEQAAPLIGFAPLLPTYLPEGWVLPPVGTVRPYIASFAGDRPGSYMTELGPPDVMESMPDGRFRRTGDGPGILMAQRLVTPTTRDYCGERARDRPDTSAIPPTPLILDNGIGGCVANTGAPESRVYWFRRDGIEVSIIATSVPDVEVLRIAESLQ